MEGMIAAGAAALLVVALRFLLQGISRVEVRDRGGPWGKERRDAE